MTESLWSDRGEVLDLSRGGMRLIANRKLKGEITIRLYSFQGTINVTGSVVRTRRIGFRRHEIGVSFEALPASLQQTLVSIACAHGLSQAA